MIFSIISDIHMGPDGYSDRGDLRKLGYSSEKLVQKFVAHMNDKIHPSFVVQLGDVIEDSNVQDDKKNYSRALELLTKLDCPLYHVAGNHDVKQLTEQELKDLTEQETLYNSFNSDNFHFVVLFSKRDENMNITISEEQIEWLKKDLDKTNLKTVVFVHHSLADQDLTGNYWFEGYPERSLISNRQEVRNVLEKSEKVVGVINGHLHWNRVDIHNGIPYFNIQSLVENFKEDRTPSDSHAIVSLDQDRIVVDVVGNDTARYSFQFKEKREQVQ